MLSGHTGDVRSLVFGPDGGTLVSGSTDDSVRIWNPNTGEQIRRLNGHSAEVWGVDYSPNGQMIASSSEDGFVKLWNPSDGALITHMVHNAAVIPVRFRF